MRSRRRPWWLITRAGGCCTPLTRRRALRKSAARCCKACRTCAGRDRAAELGPGRTLEKIDGDSSEKRGRVGKDAPRRALCSRSLERAAQGSQAGNHDDGPRETRRGKNRRKTGQGGVQGISRLSLRAVHLGEQRDRSRDSVAEAEVARGRYRLDRFRDGSGRLLRGFGGHCSGWEDSARSAQASGCDPAIPRPPHYPQPPRTPPPPTPPHAATL